MTLSEKFARLAGVEWHESDVWHEAYGYFRVETCIICGYKSASEYDKEGRSEAKEQMDKHIKESNPSFSDPREVLKVMMAWKDFKLFMARLEYGDFLNVDAIDWSGHIDLDYITEPNKLLKAAIEWLKEKER